MSVYYATTAGGAWSSATTWATQSNQATGGAGVPTAADDVVLDQFSGAVTMTTAGTCRSIDASLYTNTLTINGSLTWSIGGATDNGSFAIKFGSSMTYAQNGTVQLMSTTATNLGITSGGRTFGAFVFGVTSGQGAWTLNDAFIVDSTHVCTLNAGTLTTNNQNFTVGTFSASGANVKAVHFGSSNITITASSGSVWAPTGTNTTLDMGTSTLTCNGGTYAGANTFYSVVCVSGSNFFQSTNTFTNLTVQGSATQAWFGQGQTITGSLTCNGTSQQQRVYLYSNHHPGGQQTLTLGSATVSLTNVDFEDIILTGTGAPYSGTNIGDWGGNSGITPTASRTLYGIPTTSGTTRIWNSGSVWSTDPSSSRTAITTIPMPQDDIVLDSITGAGTWTSNGSGIGNSTTNLVGGRNVTCLSGFTGIFGYANSNTNYFGSITLVAGMTTSGTSSPVFYGRGSLTLTTAGVAWSGGVSLGGANATWTLADDYYSPSRNLGLAASGFQSSALTLNTNGHNISCAAISSGNSNAKTINAGGFAATWTLTGVGGGNPINMSGASFTNTGNVTLNFTGTTHGLVQLNAANVPTFLSATFTTGTLLQILSSFTFGTLTIPPGTQVTLAPGITLTVLTGSGWNVQGQNWGYIGLTGSNPTGQYISTPDQAPLRLTGSMTLDIKVALASWSTGQQQALMAKSQSASSYTYAFFVTGSGGLQLAIYPALNGTGGIFFNSSANVPYAAGATGWIRASLDTSSGTSGACTFYTSSDGVTWTQLGSVSTNTIASANPMQTNTVPLTVGADATGANWQATGNFYRARVFGSALGSGSGSPLFDADFSQKPFGWNSFSESANNATVSINGAYAQTNDGRISFGLYTAGVPYTIAVQDSTPIVTDYLTLQDSRTLGGRFDAGQHSLKNGNVAGWTPAFAADINPGQPFPGVINPSLMRMATR